VPTYNEALVRNWVVDVWRAFQTGRAVARGCHSTLSATSVLKNPSRSQFLTSRPCSRGRIGRNNDGALIVSVCLGKMEVESSEFHIQPGAAHQPEFLARFARWPVIDKQLGPSSYLKPHNHSSTGMGALIADSV
jgi:hypothetical protein